MLITPDHLFKEKMKYFLIILSLYNATLKATEIFISNEESWAPYTYMAAKVSYNSSKTIFPGGYQRMELESKKPTFYIELSYATLNYHYITRFWITNLPGSNSDKIISLERLFKSNELPVGLIILRREDPPAQPLEEEEIKSQEFLYKKHNENKENKKSVAESSKVNDSFLNSFYRAKISGTTSVSNTFISKFQAQLRKK